MATASTTLPYQQQQPAGAAGEILANPEAVPSKAWQYSSSGSIGPFFAVISVLTVLSVLSCIFGRMYSRRRGAAPTPLESIEGNGCFGWMKQKCWRCMPAGDVHIAAQVMGFRDEKNDAKVRDSEVPNPPQP
ncbi:hypothetical protein FEM48_Zijuj05G0114000 [Ziziphus jujuba var. spinosa]|uniref:Transmembrane protein n=1 Tax=Ziziphus jujuba var. spinosa TaxID=714518 RepID=A0A978VEN9_ZIZJJ|nr:hypothetical protein FEM48_Zijuj05G0114000 [Ziziphus jujuba var. spinosa]